MAKLGDKIEKYKQNPVEPLNFNKGRPTLNKRIQSAVSEEEKNLLTAKRGYQSESDYIRQLLRKDLGL